MTEAKLGPAEALVPSSPAALAIDGRLIGAIAPRTHPRTRAYIDADPAALVSGRQAEHIGTTLLLDELSCIGGHAGQITAGGRRA
jgi:hypothetical protein